MPRKELNEDGVLLLSEGDYGKSEHGTWQVRPPGMHAGSIPHHTVKEHEDGAITVSPSILMLGSNNEELWHGWLRKGVWSKA